MSNTGSIAGTIFTDKNGNGTLDAGETGLSGVVVTLADTTGATVATTTSNAQGQYSFGGLADGTYSVVFASQSGAKLLPDTALTQTVTIASGQAIAVNEGFYAPGAIAGFVYSDANGNGIQDGSEGYLDGVTVNLLDASGKIVATTVSAANAYFPHGVYEFDNVKPGSYKIQTVIPNAAAPQPLYTAGPVASGQNLFGLNIGVEAVTTPAGTDSIAGTVFTDANGNGTLDSGEAGIAGDTVTLDNASGAGVATTTSDANGHYSFSGLADGTYSVVFGTPSGTVADSTTPGSVTLTTGQAATGVNEGFVTAAVIAGQVFSDTNGNGTYQSGERFVDGVTVNLIDGTGKIVASTTSVLNGPFDGFYDFINVAPGSYHIQAVVPGVSTPQPLQSTGPLTPGQQLFNFEIATVPLTSQILGTVFNDANGDRIQESGEAGIAGVSVLLIKDPGTANATALETILTDANGHYSFNGPLPGNYSVVVATPEGLKNTTTTTISVPNVADGTKVTANVGFATNPTPDATAFPAATSINILLRGQSNANYFYTEGFLAQLQTAVEHELGFDGVNQKINLIASTGNADGSNTLNPGTGLINDWLSALNGDYTQGWTAKNLELGLLTDLARQPASVQANPTLVLWLHNESDSEVAGLTTAEWTSAVQYEAGLVRAVLGQDASTAPYLFVNAIPFLSTIGQAAHDDAEQNIKIGMAQLASDPVFNAAIVAQESDVTMAHDGAVGGAHLGVPDQQQLLARLTVSLADELAASALPGSPIALAGGHVDSVGPKVTAATAVVGNPNQLLLTVSQDTATGFEALNSVAAAGVGWSIRNNATGANTALEASGTAAKIIDGTHLLVTFDQTIPTGGLLFYDWGADRIAPSATAPGNGDAVYDNNNLPISADPNGVAINANAVPVAGSPTGAISGVAFTDANGNASLDSGETGIAGVSVILTDATGAKVVTTTSDAQGHYSFAGLADGPYSVTFATPGGEISENSAPVPVTVANQATVSNVDVGFYVPAAISGFVQLAGAGAFLDNVKVALINASGKVVATTLSSPNQQSTSGAYYFDNVAPGTYTVEAVIPNATTPPVPTASVQVVSGQTVQAFNVAVQSTAVSGIDSISGVAVVEANGAPVAFAINDGVTVTDASGKVVATTTTDGTGAYQVASLADGDYTVSFAPTAPGFVSTNTTVRLSAAQRSQQVVGVLYTPATVSGTVFNDSNGDGALETGKAGVAGVTVQLLDSAGKTVMETTTGSNGGYTFAGLQSAAYSVQFSTPNGDVATTPALVSLGQVAAGQAVTQNAGVEPVSGAITISGVAFTGVQGPSEVGLAGVDVVLVTAAGNAVQTAVTDANGHYAFSNVANGTYSVTFATPLGDVATTPTTVQAGAVANGQPVTTVNVGFTPTTTPTATPVPASTTLNIILRGQSNSQYFLQDGMLAKLQSDVEAMLGFDGVNQKINLLADFTSPTGANTINSGTALIGNWLQPINGDYTQGWTATNLELGLLSAVSQQSDAFKAAPTAVVWLHNETDSVNNPNITPAEWESAAAFEAGLVRGVLGQSASTVPYLFVNAIPFPSNGALNATTPAPAITQADQAIRVGMAALASNPAFNGQIAAQASDVTMDANLPGDPGGAHMNADDQYTVEQRLAASIADTFSASALPGSPLALAGGNVDNLGPQVLAATAVAGHPNQLLLTLQQDSAIALDPLSAAAANGVGWSLRTTATGASSTLEASGTSAQIVDATHLLVTFDGAVPAGALLFYGWGSARIAPTGLPGHGDAVYDNNGLPAWTNPNGVAVTASPIAVSSTISGVAFADTNGNGTLDGGETALAGIGVVLANAAGATVATATTDSNGAYSFAIATPGTYTVDFTPPGGTPLSGGTASQTVNVAANQIVANVNAGFYADATVAGFVYNDNNGGGLGATTGLIDGEKVELLNAAGTVVATTTSSKTDPLAPGADGLYSFQNVAPGTYSVRFTPPAGDTAATPALNNIGSLVSGQALELDSGLIVPAGTDSIAGTVFLDANSNGTLDAGEVGIAGDNVILENAAGKTIETTTSDAQGKYNFSGLADGTYSVVFASQSGTKLLPDTALTQTVTIANGQAVAANAGFYATGAIAGFVYSDANGNGIQDGSEGYLDGVTVNLLDASGKIIATTVSAANAFFPHGVYEFDNVKPGSYKIQTVIPNAAAPQPLYTAGPLASGQNLFGLNIGVEAVTTPVSTDSIAGTVFTDTNANGTLDTGETGIANDTVTLENAAGATLATTTSDAKGHYTFGGLADGTYSVAFASQSGAKLLPDTALTQTVTIANGQAVAANEGFYAPAAIAGFIYTDTNGDGSLDGSETPVDGVTVNLLDMNGNIVATTVSAANAFFPHGVYEFDNVKPGSYQIQTVIPNAPAPQPLYAVGSLASGQNLFGLNIGIEAVKAPAGTASITGTAFADLNANGTSDQGDTGLGAVAVALTDATGATVANTTTDSKGLYAFTELAAGTYGVSFTTPSGYVADSTTPLSVAVNDQPVTAPAAGFYQPANIAGFVVSTANNADLDGVRLNLLDANGNVVATTVSGPNDGFPHGVYNFFGVKPGAYQIQAVIPNAEAPPAPVPTGALASGQNLFDFVIGIANVALGGTASISGTAYLDANGDKTFDAGDTALASDVVQLRNVNGQVVATTATDNSGGYTFGGLTAGSYTVNFTNPGTAGQAGYQPSPGQTVAVSNGQTLTGVDGAFAATTAIYGTVFNDINGDGIAEAGETGLNGLTVQLLNSDRDPIASTTTGTNAVYQSVVGQDGSYSFAGLQPGTYTVRFAAPNGDILTTPTLNIEHLTAGQAVEVDAVVTSSTGTISVSGTTYVDANGNGQKDGGEAGLAGISVALIKNAGTSSASAMATTITDADGNYSFAGIAPGMYSVVFARPDGETATTPTTVSLGALATGNAATANAGFTASAPPSSPGPVVTPPTSAPSANTPFTLNIVIRGQSNSQNLAALNNQDTVNSLQSQIEALLGFNGTTQQVKVLADYGKADGDNTINSGTSLIGNWLAPVDGNYQNGWSAQSLELGFLSDLSQNLATLQSGPTAVVWLHNESDSLNASLTTPEWESAVQYEAGLVRGLIGQNVPYEFVNAIPFTSTGTPEQAIRAGMSDLANDPSFNGAIAAQSSDVAADNFGAGFNGGHLDNNDLQQLINRLSLSLADTFSSYAVPGSPLAQAGGSVDDKGPQVIAATTVAGNAHQLLLTVQQDQATSFEILSAAAAIGTGWSIRNNAAGPNSTLEASGTAAQIVDGTHILVTFDNAVPTGGELFYGWGSGLIAPPGQTGIGAAVYDNNGLPIWTNGNGVAVTPPGPIVTASANAATVQATSAAGGVETFTGSVIDSVDGTSDQIGYTEQLAGGATKIVHSGDTFAIGTHTIIASATDTQGLTGSSTPFSFVVQAASGTGGVTAPPSPPPSGPGGSTPPVATTPNLSLFGSISHDVSSEGGDIYALYQTILGHAPGATEIEAGVAALDSGASLKSVAQGLLASGEYTQHYGRASAQPRSGFVDLMFVNAMDRHATAAELKTWDQQLAAGTPRARVAVEIAGLPETHADLAPAFQAGVFVPSPTDSGIARLYYALLGHAPDAAGLASFEASGASLKTVARDLIHSSDYASLHGSPGNSGFVESLFEGAFGHGAGGTSAEPYLHSLNSGASRATVAVTIAQSAEAIAHLNANIETGFHVA